MRKLKQLLAGMSRLYSAACSFLNDLLVILKAKGKLFIS